MTKPKDDLKEGLFEELSFIWNQTESYDVFLSRVLPLFDEYASRRFVSKIRQQTAQEIFKEVDGTPRIKLYEKLMEIKQKYLKGDEE